MKLTFDIQQKDIEEHYTALWKGTGKGSIAGQVLNVFAWAVIAYGYLYFFGPADKSHIVLFFVVLVATSISEWLRTKRLRSKVVNDEANPALGTQNLTFSTEGIAYSNEVSNGNILWRGIQRIDETASLFQIYVGSFEAILIPKRSVENIEEFRSFIGDLRKNV